MPRDPEIDPALHLIPQEQLDRVLNQDMCDIDPSFLGFTEVYKALASIIPLHWTIVDLGCAYSPQAFFFTQHKAYIGVDYGTNERFAAHNTKHFDMTIREFIEGHAGDLDRKTTFAICSYVPPWHDDNQKLVREHFQNVFVYYPAGSSDMVEAFVDMADLIPKSEGL